MLAQYSRGDWWDMDVVVCRLQEDTLKVMYGDGMSPTGLRSGNPNDMDVIIARLLVCEV